LTARGVRPIITGAGEGLGMSDPDRELRERRERSIGTMSMIAFILAALAGLISIIYVRPMPADDPPKVTSPK
jgi:hypothetical protein